LDWFSGVTTEDLARGCEHLLAIADVVQIGDGTNSPFSALTIELFFVGVSLLDDFDMVSILDLGAWEMIIGSYKRVSKLPM
jgi:hypothetical protein